MKNRGYKSNVVTKETRMIDDNTWLMSLVRKAGAEHAFIIIEGYEEQDAIIRRYDAFINNKKEGYIKIVQHEKIGTIKEVNEYYVNNIMKDEKEELRYKSWDITPIQAEKLHQAITKDIEENNLKYELYGAHSISASYKQSASKGFHNCLTWAQEKINNLGDKNIHIPTEFTDYFSFSVTSHYIGPKEEQGNRLDYTSKIAAEKFSVERKR